MPASDAAVFGHQARLVVRSSLWLGLDWLAFGLALAWRDPSVGWWVAVPLLAAGQWAAGLALAAALVRWRPNLPFAAGATVLGFAFFLILRALEQPALFAGLCRSGAAGGDRGHARRLAGAGPRGGRPR